MIIDCHNHLGVDLLFYLNGWHPYAQDLPTLVTEGRHCGVDRWVVFPMVSNLTFGVSAMRQGRLETAGGIERVPYAYENERMLREVYQLYPDLGKSALPFAILDPLRETEAQVKKLRELYKEFPFYGLKIQATIIKSDVTALLREGRVFLELAEELNLPFLIHSSVGEDKWSQAKDILKVAEATPSVRFCLAHSCRFDHECLDRVAELPNTWFDCSAHRIHCECVQLDMPNIAKADRRFPADYRDPDAVLQALAEAYPTKFIWGSDTPFQSYVDTEYSLRSTYAEEVACLNTVKGKLHEAIAHDNLLALLQLKDEGILTRV